MNGLEPYWTDGQSTLYKGDCEQILSEMLSEYARIDAQIVVTSPPYNMGLVPGGNGRGMYRPGASNKGGRFRDGYEEFDDALPQDEYDAFHRRVLDLLWQVIPDDGAIFWNHRQRIEHGKVRLPLGMDFGIPLRQIITWDRGTGIAPSLRHFTPVAEWIFLFAKPDFKLTDHGRSGLGDVWRLGMARAGSAGSSGHPAPFPESLPLHAIDSCAARSVLDPFAGTGTTLRAANRLGIPAIGIELCERYCVQAVSRLRQGSLFPAGGAA
jgi:site-specific DNA-methyltransferase (adenine-specific)